MGRRHSEVLTRALTGLPPNPSLRPTPQGMSVSMDQFIDVCIMCGCDYVNNIRGIGPVRALQMIQKHGSVEVSVGRGAAWTVGWDAEGRGGCGAHVCNVADPVTWLCRCGWSLRSQLAYVWLAMI